MSDDDRLVEKLDQFHRDFKNYHGDMARRLDRLEERDGKQDERIDDLEKTRDRLIGAGTMFGTLCGVIGAGVTWILKWAGGSH